MIVVDIEASGAFDPLKYGIWQIGATELENPSNTFLEEARIDNADQIHEGALKVCGITEEELRDKTKQSQKQLLENFFSWVEKIENKILVAHNTPFDYSYLILRAQKYGLDFPFGYRSVDLHVIAFQKYLELNKKPPIENGKSIFNLRKVIEFCGMQDPRISLNDLEVVKEGSPHNALEDAKLEAECMSRILYGKGLLKEFEQFPIPNALKSA